MKNVIKCFNFIFSFAPGVNILLLILVTSFDKEDDEFVGFEEENKKLAPLL